ncbi:hypothetical protein PIB30_020225 [Stylosanthes scabra]|uniref:F-box domain-containing protein n=1 Tax=Stylosanthes scabra TaxID=79078 RepID=A0ABU6S8H3_9FABA|nr:hypothetical protein [Stylosanthes scabra]
MSSSEYDTPFSPRSKRRRLTKTETQSQSENDNEEDRLSALPDCVLLHVLSFVNAKHAVQTCVLSRRWKNLWKLLSTLVLHSSHFWTFKDFTKFVSALLTRRDASSAVFNLDFERLGSVEPHVLKRIVNYAISHNAIFSCKTLTSLKLSVSPRDHIYGSTLFPTSLNLTALTSLHLQHFTFCASGGSAGDRTEPFSGCERLSDLVIDHCTVKDAKALCISNRTLVNLTVRSNQSKDFYKIELSTSKLRSFRFSGIPYQQICGSDVPSIEDVDIDAEIRSNSLESSLILFSWLLELANVKSLTVSASTLQVLFLIPNLLEVKLPCLEVMKPSSPLPDRIVNFLLQNSPSAEVAIVNCERSQREVNEKEEWENVRKSAGFYRIMADNSAYNDPADHFSSCGKLKTLVLDNCVIKNSRILQLSCSSNLSFLKEVTIDFDTCVERVGNPKEEMITMVCSQSAFIVIEWLKVFANIRSLRICSLTLKVLSLTRVIEYWKPGLE